MIDKKELENLIKYININKCGATSSLVLINKIVKDVDETLKIMDKEINWYTE
tara:strand:+ start:2008 stop:2163 length:156 start_codon:yes stop_codon:yes gene_type:complete